MNQSLKQLQLAKLIEEPLNYFPLIVQLHRLHRSSQQVAVRNGLACMVQHRLACFFSRFVVIALFDKHLDEVGNCEIEILLASRHLGQCPRCRFGYVEVLSTKR